MEPVDERYLLAALERATTHQNLAPATLRHPAPSMANSVNSAATSQHVDESERRAADADDPAAPQRL